MRDLFLSLAIPGGLLYALYSASGSILVLTWICFQRPHTFSYGLWNRLPTFMLALGIAILSNVLRGQFRPKFPPILVLYLCIMLWITLSAAFAFDTKHAWDFYGIFVPALFVTPVVLFACVHDLGLLKKVIWVAAGSIAINAFKAGTSLTLRGGGHLSEQISGFVGDNNVFGLVLCLVVAILMGMRRTLPDTRWVKVLFYTIVAINVLCIIYTKSRGALLSLGIIMVLSSLLSGKAVRYLALLGAIVTIGYSLIPSTYFDRLGTLKDVSADRSAAGRLEAWVLSWDEALRHPILGVGPDNHMLYNAHLEVDVELRVAHSVYFQTLGELGFPALLFYLLFLGTGLVMLYRTWRMMVPLVQKHPDLVWVRDVSFWMACALAGYCFGAGLLNMLYIEFPWYMVMLGCMLMPLVKLELARRATQGGPQTSPAESASSASRPHRARPIPGVPGFPGAPDGTR